MHRHRRQCALVWLSLVASVWCGAYRVAKAQLLVDRSEDEAAVETQQVSRDSRPSTSSHARLAVSSQPEEILESPAETIYEEPFEPQFEPQYDEAYGSYEAGRHFHAGPLAWLFGRIEEMKVQQETTSWLNRPVSFGVFGGHLWPDDPIPGRVNQSNGFVGGYYLGEDLTINWGWEMRLALAALDVNYDQVPWVTRTDDIILWDLNFHYYPWDNARWRPYATFGFGLAQFDFGDEFDRRVRKSTFGVPVGIGMKYLIYPTSAFRLELVDNIALATGPIDTQHNVSLSAGLEIRFGGVRRSYWPWNPGQSYGYW